MFSFAFIARALLVGTLVALCSSLLGVSLVLKRYSLIGDGLSHVGFGAVAIALALGWTPLSVSIPIVLIAAFLLLRLSSNSKIRGDAATAIIMSSSLAIGITIMSLSTGVNADVCNFMFGTILAMSMNDVYLSVAVAIIVFVLYIVFYNRIFAVTFDETFARATGTKANHYITLLAILTALIIVVGMRMMGALLISSLVVFPALTSMRVFKSFKSVVVSSAITAVICFFVGMVMSYKFNIPTGASVVIVNLAAFLLFSLFSFLGGSKMKKVALMLICVVFLVGCGSDRIVISERNFTGLVFDILTNQQEYQGKTINIVGMYSLQGMQHVVYRNVEGCCPGEYSKVGFNFNWDGDVPQEGEWIEVTGTLRERTLILSELNRSVPPQSEVVEL